MGYNRNRNINRKRKGYRKKKRGIDLKRIGVVAVATVAIVICGYVVYSHLPIVTVNKAIAAGGKYTDNADSQSAIESYQKALDIDKESVTAYSNLAGAYLSLDDLESAKSVFYEGYQNTGNTALLDNYHTVVLNQAVYAMNDQKTDLNTVLSIVDVLEENGENAHAVELLNAASDRCFADSYSSDMNQLFRSGDENMPTYEQYADMIGRMVSVYQNNGSEELKGVIQDYLVPNIDSFALDVANVDTYLGLIDSTTAVVGSNDEIDSFKACLNNSKEVLSVFSDIFTQLDVGNVDELRDFVVSDSYIALRDVFLNDQDTPQENTTYVPISREAIVLDRKDSTWAYRFMNFEENPQTSGVITLWANFFEDNGVQRAAISYEPAAVNGNYYPHTQYSVTYLYSYITSGKSTKVAQMNYRLDTTITQDNGEVDETVVGDWGGANEWVMDIDTIESRIKA